MAIVNGIKMTITQAQEHLKSHKLISSFYDDIEQAYIVMTMRNDMECTADELRAVARAYSR